MHECKRRIEVEELANEILDFIKTKKKECLFVKDAILRAKECFDNQLKIKTFE